jgi:hypothetical protein
MEKSNPWVPNQPLQEIPPIQAGKRYKFTTLDNRVLTGTFKEIRRRKVWPDNEEVSELFVEINKGMAVGIFSSVISAIEELEPLPPPPPDTEDPQPPEDMTINPARYEAVPVIRVKKS